MKDPSTPLRSFVKGLSWRVISIFVLCAITWFFTGDLTVTGKIGALDSFVKIWLFFGHERVWHQIPFGKRIDILPPS